LLIERTWDGASIEPAERASVWVTRADSGLSVAVESAFHGDAAPTAPVGRTPGLWEHEVVEVFIAGEGEAYLELEFGPHGHYLALWLEGIRRPASLDLELRYHAERAGGQWRGLAQLGPSVPLPPPPWRLNAYAIHGLGSARRYLAHAPVPGAQPDFHRPDSFVPWEALPA